MKARQITVNEPKWLGRMAMKDRLPGDWWWMANREHGIYCILPNGQSTSIPTAAFYDPEDLDQVPKWTITGDGDTITVSPSIHFMPGKGPFKGEWHGYLTRGEWVPCG